MSSFYAVQVQLLINTKLNCSTNNGQHRSGTTIAKTANPLHQNCSPSDVVHLLLLADVDLEVSVALVDADNLVLIDLVT